MKISRMIKEELIPLSTRQQVSLLVTIACVFQFVLFFAPTLADTAVKQALAATTNQSDSAIIADTMTKSATPDPNAAKIINSLDAKAKSDYEASSTTDAIVPKVKTDVSHKAETSSSPEKYEVVKTSLRKITAYNSEVAQTDNDPCITANGFDVCKYGKEDTIAANFLPFGTKVKIPSLFGDRVFVVRDRMNKRFDNRIDIWMKNRHEALKFGVKVAKIEIIKQKES